MCLCPKSYSYRPLSLLDWAHTLRLFLYFSPWQSTKNCHFGGTMFFEFVKMQRTLETRETFFFSWLHPAACGILILQVGPSAVKAHTPGHWATRGFPQRNLTAAWLTWLEMSEGNFSREKFPQTQRIAEDVGFDCVACTLCEHLRSHPAEVLRVKNHPQVIDQVFSSSTVGQCAS